MTYELKQELRLAQKLLLTPQLQLSIKLLQLSRQELVDTIRQELEKNPVLEDVGDTPETPVSQTSAEGERHEVDWQDYIQQAYDNYDPRRLDFNENFEDNPAEPQAPLEETLKDCLMAQLRHVPLSEKEAKIGEFIIGNIDERGYLSVIEREEMDEEIYRQSTVEKLSTLMGVSTEEVDGVLRIIHGFDPPGVGARTLKECLMLQAARLQDRDELVDELVLKHLELLARKNYKAIAKQTGVEVERVLKASRFITEFLNPVPGAGFGSDESRIIVPDVSIQKIDGAYLVFLNEDGLPKLKVSSYYKKMLNNGGCLEKEVKGYVQERLRSALWLIKSVHQRQRTLRRVVESIVKFQEDFLEKGLQYLKPLVLKDVAEDVGMHESTISRVTTNKYAHTPRGIFELKYFFSTAVGQNDGTNLSAEYIKDKLKSVLEEEDTTNPLSDQEISEKLKAMGINLARRTVAKYREELGFLSSSARGTV